MQAGRSESSRSIEATRVALVTGSSTGIGKNIALDLVRLGFSVVITGTNPERVNEVVEFGNRLAGTRMGDVFGFVGDLNEKESVNKLIEFIKTKFTCLHVLVNNVCSRGESTRNLLSAADDLLIDDVESTFNLNCGLPVYIVHRLLREKLFPSKGSGEREGVVINISSIAAQVVVPLHLYSITKACMTELTRQLAAISDTTNLLAVTISPGPILTSERPHHGQMNQFTLTKSVGSTQDISSLVIFAVKNARLFNGQDLTIDGGYTAKQIQPSARPPK